MSSVSMEAAPARGLEARMPDEQNYVTIELNPRDRQLYDRLRSRVVAPNPGGRSGVRDMLLLLPDLTVLLSRMILDGRVPVRSKVIALLGVGYVLSPIDLIPAPLFGPIGLVDDLLVVSAALSKLVNDVHPDVVRSHWPGQGDALHAIQRASEWSSDFLTKRVGATIRNFLRRRPSR
jgi:uncharacterized membrane protein YkvA (DUF1232 family)